MLKPLKKKNPDQSKINPRVMNVYLQKDHLFIVETKATSVTIKKVLKTQNEKEGGVCAELIS